VKPAISITCYECVSVALGIQHEHAQHCHLWPALLYNFFPRYLINGSFLEREIYWTQNVFLFLQILSETFTILKKTSEKYNKKMYIGLQVQSCENLIKLEFSKQIFENNKIWGSQKFVQWEKEVFHADGRTNGKTDMTKLSFSSVLRTHLKLKWPYYQPQVNLRFYRNLR